MSISDKNNHIEDYLNYYIALSHSPKFAILLKGGWGSGKTWFIKKYYENLNQTRVKSFWTRVKSFWTQDVSVVPKSIWNKITRKQIHKANRCLYISLNGLNSISDIDESIYQQLHPFWSSEQVKAVGTVIKSLLKGSLKIDLTNDGKDRATWNMQISDIPDDFEYSNFKEVKRRVLIFDDLERCSIDTKEILGYINRFVEFQGLKVLIIANEEEISNIDEEYKRIKEKTIGQILEIYPDFEDALNDFLTQIDNPKAKEIILNHANFIFSLFEKSKCTNLRILNRIIVGFEKIFSRLPEKIVKQGDAIKEILEVLTILSIEISNDQLQPQQISSIDKSLSDKLSSVSTQVGINKDKTNEDKNKKDLSSLFEKYGIKHTFFMSKEWFPNLSWWENFFDKGIINKEILELAISTSKYFQDETTPNWLKLMNYSTQSDGDFKNILNQVCLEYENREFEDIGIIKHITGILLFFSEVGLYSKDKTEIISDAKKYIDHLIIQGKLNPKYNDKADYMGIQFSCMDTNEFKEFNNYIKQKQEEVRDVSKEALKLMDTMIYDISAFRATICLDSLRTDIEERYYDFPIFNYLMPNVFLQNILKLTNENKIYVFYCLKERYQLTDAYPILIDELDFLKQFQHLLKQEISKRQGELSGFILDKLNSERLVDTINHLEKQNAPQTNNIS